MATLPARSVARPLYVYVSSGVAVGSVKVQLPAVAVPLAIEVAPRSSSTLAPASAVPSKVGEVSLVMLSVCEEPESEVDCRSGSLTAGAVVSMVTDSPGVEVALLPARSVARPLYVYVSSGVAVGSVKVQLPAVAVPLATEVAPRSS